MTDISITFPLSDNTFGLDLLLKILNTAFKNGLQKNIVFVVKKTSLLDTRIHGVVASGPGLVFVTYPELVLSLPISFFWAAIFFAMMLVLGIDTEFCSVESLITGLVDNWPTILLPRRRAVVIVTCVSLFLAGLPMMTQVT